ncbi:MAG: nucleotidyltransferase domain-containing protein [Deltaproteobacteria bacterium]|nr:nucleotidyltransferase domain-containing protein [Deltaproteobacteria bacterium]
MAYMLGLAVVAGVDVGPYILAWRERFRQAETARARLAEQARSRLPALVRHLAAAGARRVWLFGSLADEAFHEGSDIDLAAEGLPAGAALFRLAVELDRVAAPFRIDLVPLEDAHAPVRAGILARGELLHDGH